MVYIGNIFKEYENLKEDERILLKFGNGDEVTITAGDTVEKENGDLKITRNINDDRTSICYVDTAFVKYISKSRRFL